MVKHSALSSLSAKQIIAMFAAIIAVAAVSYKRDDLRAFFKH